MPDTLWSLNNGLAVILVCGGGFGLWKLIWYAMYQYFGDGKAIVGIAHTRLAQNERYVASTESLHEVLKETQRNQVVTCQAHVAGFGTIGDMIRSQVDIGIVARDQATAAAEQATAAARQASQGNASLTHIEKSLEDRTPMLASTAHIVQQLKSVALANCEMCRTVAEQLGTQFPTLAEVVSPHCDAIKKKLEETA